MEGKLRIIKFYNCLFLGDVDKKQGQIYLNDSDHISSQNFETYRKDYPDISEKLILFLKFIHFLAAFGLRCCARAFSSCGEWGLLFIAVHGLHIAVASLVAERGL